MPSTSLLARFGVSQPVHEGQIFSRHLKIEIRQGAPGAAVDQNDGSGGVGWALFPEGYGVPIHLHRVGLKRTLAARNRRGLEV